MTRIATLLLLLAAAPAAAQAPRDVLLQDWDRLRGNVLAFVDAAPDSILGYAPTPGVRSFAEQIEHIAIDNVIMVAAGVQGLEEPPSLGDRERYLRDKAELRAYVERTFDYVAGVIRDTPAPALRETATVFGRYTLARWRILEAAHEHAVWTLGQVVPYLRLHGVEPPSYAAFPATT